MSTEHLILAAGFGWIAGSAFFVLYLLALWVKNFPQVPLWRRAIATFAIMTVPVGVIVMATVLYQWGMNEPFVLLVEVTAAAVAFSLSVRALRKGIRMQVQIKGSQIK